MVFLSVVSSQSLHAELLSTFSFRWCFDRFVSFSYLRILFPSSEGFYGYGSLSFFFENLKKIKFRFERRCFLKHSTGKETGRGERRMIRWREGAIFSVFTLLLSIFLISAIFYPSLLFPSILFVCSVFQFLLVLFLFFLSFLFRVIVGSVG